MSKSTGPVSSRFFFEGCFLGFASGKKAPFKYLIITGPCDEVYIKLRKSLRMMLFRYLVPGDWVQIVGQQTWDYDNDVPSYKADEVVRISTPSHLSVAPKQKDVPPLTNNNLSNPSQVLTGVQPNSKQGKRSKILICQKSGCRKRGGTVVAEVVEQSLSRLGLAEQVTVKYTGCMDRCKSGPNVVFMPSKTKYSCVEPEMVDELVKQHCVVQSFSQSQDLSQD